MKASWRRALDQQDAEAASGLKCRYWPDLQRLGVECGKPATHSWKTVARGEIPVCDDCVNKSGVLRIEAKPLHDCLGGCGLKLKSPGRCVSCFIEWCQPKPAERAS